MSLKEISGAVTLNGRLTEGPKCCLKECEKWCWHSKNIFEKIIGKKRQRKEFTYLHFCWIVIPQQLARWTCWMWPNPNIGAIFQSRLQGSIFQISGTSKSEAFNVTQKKKTKQKYKGKNLHTFTSVALCCSWLFGCGGCSCYFIAGTPPFTKAWF